MRIGIDARLYGPQNGGLGRYLEKLIEHLEKIDSENQYIIFLRQENFDLFQPKNPNFKKILADYRWYTFKEHYKMPGVIKRERVDLMHFPHFNAPLFYGALLGFLKPFAGLGKFVVTIHDLILLEFPVPRMRVSTLGPIKYWIKYWAHRVILRSTVRRAEKVITVSEYSKKQLIKYFKLPFDKIIVTYEAASQPRIKLEPSRKRLEKYGVYKKYLLYVGKAFPHKNLDRLLKVFRDLDVGFLGEYQLVLVGQEDYFYKRLKREAERLGLSGQKVVFAGFVFPEDLPYFYQLASLYVFPSFVEGFGLPPLEAMAHGLPVACSNTSCLPEILGNAAVYFNPASEKEILEALKQGLSDQILRKKLVLAGFERVKLYSWEKCARQTLKVYQEI